MHRYASTNAGLDEHKPMQQNFEGDHVPHRCTLVADMECTQDLTLYSIFANILFESTFHDNLN